MRFLDKKHPVEIEDSLTANDSRAKISVADFEPQSSASQDYTPASQPSNNQEYTPVSQPSNSQENNPVSQSSQKNIKRKTKSKRSINKEDSDFDKQMLKIFQENSKIFQNDDVAFFASLLSITSTFFFTLFLRLYHTCQFTGTQSTEWHKVTVGRVSNVTH